MALRDSERRYLVDKEFRNSLIAKFNETFARAEVNKDGLLNK